MKWEGFKSFLLVVLTFSSFILTGIFMGQSSGGLNESKFEIIDLPLVEITSFSEIIHPQGLYINFGGDSHTAFFFDKKNLWQEIYDDLRVVFEVRTPKAIDKNSWDEVVQERNVRLDFGNGLSSNEFFNSNYEEDLNIQEIIFPLLSQDFILVKSNDQYYELTSYFDSAIEDIVAGIESTLYVEYKTIEKRFSIQSILEQNGIEADKNMTAVPIETPNDFLLYKSEFLVNTNDVSSIELYVKKVFGSDLSFVKKLLTYDDTIIYLSDYGKRSLSFAINGEVEYINNLSEENTVITEISQTEDLIQKSLSFINYIEGNSDNLYMAEHTREGDIDYFFFNSYVNQHLIHYFGNQEGYSIEVQIKNDKIIYYKSNRRKNLQELQIENFWEKGLSFSSLFDRNFDVISENYQSDMKIDLIDDNRLYIFEIVNAIKTYDFEYYIDAQIRSNSIIPAWKIKIADTVYHFDIYEGTLLEQSKEYENGLEEN